MNYTSIFRLNLIEFGAFFRTQFSNDSDIFEKMKCLKLQSTTIFFIAVIVIHSSCASTKKQSQEPEKQLPGTVSITPSSFRCSGTVIKSNPESVIFVVKEISARGSSLFYAVNSGDTIQAVFLSPNKNIFSPGSIIKSLIEERLKMNSEKPEFIVKQIE
jgi:hypothetical protein